MRFVKLIASACFALVLFSSLALAADDALPLSLNSGYSLTPARIYPGDEVTLTVFIENAAAGIQALNAKTELLLDNSFEPIAVSETLGTIYPTSTKTSVFRFKVKDSAFAGTHKLSVNITYDRGTTGQVQRAYVVDVPISESLFIDLQDIVAPENVYLKSSFPVSAKIINIGKSSIRNLYFSVAPSTGDFTGILPVSSTKTFVGNLNPGESKTASFELFVSDSTALESHAFKLLASSVDSNINQTEFFSVNVKDRPELVISGIGYSFAVSGQKRVLQGTDFSLSVQLENISKEQAKAAQGKLLFDEPTAGIVGASESFIGSIDPDDTGSAVFDLAVLPDAKPGSHKASIVLTFTDEAGNKQELTKDFEVFVDERPAEQPVALYITLVIALAIIYFIVRMWLRRFPLRKK